MDRRNFLKSTVLVPTAMLLPLTTFAATNTKEQYKVVLQWLGYGKVSLEQTNQKGRWVELANDTASNVHKKIDINTFGPGSTWCGYFSDFEKAKQQFLELV